MSTLRDNALTLALNSAILNYRVNDEVNKRVADLVGRASLAYAAGELETTIELYRSVQRLQPDEPQAEIESFLGEIYVGLGRDADAVTSYRAVVAEEPGNVEAWWKLGEALTRMGRTAEGADAIARSDRLERDAMRSNRAGDLIEAFDRAGDLEVRADALQALIDEGHVDLRHVFHRFLVSAENADVANCSEAVCSAMIDALIGLGVQQHAGIFSDGNAPDRPFIRENIERYLTSVAAPAVERRPWWRRLGRFGRR